MALNPGAVGSVGEPYQISWTSKDSLLYAVSLNVSSDQLEYVTENSTGVTQKALPTMPVVALDSMLAITLVVQQVLIGLTIGFAVRVVFAAVEYAGELIGLQMGLNFAGFFDPVTAAQGTAVSSLFATLVAWLFVATGIAYYLNYEVLHTAYHMPDGHWLARIGLVRRLRWLHQAHHDPRLMASRNFNITYPLGDWLFGTLHRPRDGATRSAP